MNPLVLSGYGISMEVEKACLTIKDKDETIKFEPHRIPYDSIIIDGHYGAITFEALRWLAKHDVPILLMNWNGNLLSLISPKNENNGQLRIKQFEKYLDGKERINIAEKIVMEKVKNSLNLLKNLSKFYMEIDFKGIENNFSEEFKTYNNNVMKKEPQDKDRAELLEDNLKANLSGLLMYEGRIATIYWNELGKVFNKLAPDFNFHSRKNLSYSWNMNASDPINALLNYGYGILEGMVRNNINKIGLDPSIGFLHEIAPSKNPLVYDIQELFRYVIDYSVIQLLEKGLKKSDFITTENYHIRLKPETSRKLIEAIKNNFNQRYIFKNKQYALDIIMLENIKEFAKYLSNNKKDLEFYIPEIKITRNDDNEIREKVISITPEERKKKKINKSTLWYQQKKIKEGKPLKLYQKTIAKL